MQASDEIKQKLDIVDVIRDYIQMTPAGSNFKAKCPFHNEKTPSLMISPDKQIWHCFGCGKGGDMFEFVKEMEGVDFVESLRILAPKAGVVLKREDPKLRSERNRMLDILEWSRKFYHQGLIKSPRAEAARDYLAERGLKEETIEEWQIGYSPDDWEILRRFLVSKGFKDEEIIKSGMALKSQKGSGIYDRFRDRIMFPIQDLQGATVAFTARVNPAKEDTEKMGKYINSPETSVYSKGRIIFGLDKAKRAIKEADAAVLVEGQMDVISAHQAGFHNTMAASGTALTADQVQLLKRYSVNLLLAFDMDAAGQMAADRGIREALKAEMNIRVVVLPGSQDPDDCIRHDPEAWRQAVAGAKPMMQYYLDRAAAKYDLKQAEGKRQAAKEVLGILSRLENRIEQDHYLQSLANLLNVDEKILREALPRTGPSAQRPPAPAPVASSGEKKPAAAKASELVLALALKYPDLIAFLIKNLESAELVGKLDQELYRKIVLYYNKYTEDTAIGSEDGSNKFDFKDFQRWLELSAANFAVNEGNNDINDQLSGQLRHLNQLAFLAEKDYPDLSDIEARKEISQLVRALKRDLIFRRRRELENMIADMEKSGNPEEAAELMSELKFLSEESRRLT